MNLQQILLGIYIPHFSIWIYYWGDWEFAICLYIVYEWKWKYFFLSQMASLSWGGEEGDYVKIET